MWGGRGAIRKVLSHPLFDENHVTNQIVDEFFAIYSFLVEMCLMWWTRRWLS